MQFDALFERRDVVVINVDRRIIDLAAAINDYYAPKGKTLGASDSIHLASAIQYGAAEFHTVDGSGKRKKLLSLEASGMIAEKYPLIIRQPTAKAPRLSFEAEGIQGT